MKNKKNITLIVLLIFLLISLSGCQFLDEFKSYIQTPEDAINTIYTGSLIALIAGLFLFYKK